MQERMKNVPQAPYNTITVFIKKASGAVMTDVEGREYLDFAGGIGVNNVGHCHPRVVAAIKDQAEKFIHPCFHVAPYEPYVELAARLNGLAPGDFPKTSENLPKARYRPNHRRSTDWCRPYREIFCH